jgi:integrase
VSVYAGTDPLTGRQIRLRRTCKTERAAEIELGKLLEQAAAGREPETAATVEQLLDRYVRVTDWGLSTRKANEWYIRRVIKPALGRLQIRRVRGPVLDLLYAQLRRCSDPLCTGRAVTEHRNVPRLTVDPAGRQPARQQVADTIREAIRSGMLVAGEQLPSVREMSALQEIPAATCSTPWPSSPRMGSSSSAGAVPRPCQAMPTRLGGPAGFSEGVTTTAGGRDARRISASR